MEGLQLFEAIKDSTIAVSIIAVVVLFLRFAQHLVTDNRKATKERDEAFMAEYKRATGVIEDNSAILGRVYRVVRHMVDDDDRKHDV